mmetsp:Transcript_63295/g.159623  ORF Transcript_63295/g.159623 Transcript_63295/m.159623 type:complete len:200 (+) Transcript_63295:48-647(+)
MMAQRCDLLLCSVLLCLTSGVAGTCRHSDLPDSDCTPGAHFSGNECGGNPCTAETLCKSGYSKTVRKVPDSEKHAVYEAYGLPGYDHTGFCDVDDGCEVDHLISLEIGGSNEQTNLWPQPYSGTQWNARVKDTLENKLKKLFCTGAMELEETQSCISQDWIACYKKHMQTDEPIESCGGRCDWLEEGGQEAPAVAVFTV